MKLQVSQGVQLPLPERSQGSGQGFDSRVRPVGASPHSGVVPFLLGYNGQILRILAILRIYRRFCGRGGFAGGFRGIRGIRGKTCNHGAGAGAGAPAPAANGASVLPSVNVGSGGSAASSAFQFGLRNSNTTSISTLYEMVSAGLILVT